MYRILVRKCADFWLRKRPLQQNSDDGCVFPIFRLRRQFPVQEPPPVATEKLTSAKIYAALAPSLINDGGGLYLQTEPSGSKSWVFRFRLAGKDRRVGMGGLDTVDLRQARE